MNHSSVSDDFSWYAVATRSRHERVVHQQLEQYAIDAFLPTVARWSHWKDRRKRIEWPLFPGYCFARFSGRHTLPVLKCVGVVGIVSFDGKPAPIDDDELSNLRLALRAGVQCDPCPLIAEGAMVEIVRGPLMGVVGRLLRKDPRRATVILNVDLIGQAVRVEVDASNVVPRHAMARASA